MRIDRFANFLTTNLIQTFERNYEKSYLYFRFFSVMASCLLLLGYIETAKCEEIFEPSETHYFLNLLEESSELSTGEDARVCNKEALQSSSISSLALALCRDPYLAICGKSVNDQFYRQKFGRFDKVSYPLLDEAARLAAKRLGVRAKNANDLYDSKEIPRDEINKALSWQLEILIFDKVGDPNAFLEEVKKTVSSAIMANSEISAVDRSRMVQEIPSIQFISSRDYIESYGFKSFETYCGNGPMMGAHAVLGNVGASKTQIFICPGTWMYALSTVEPGRDMKTRVHEYLFGALSHEVGHRVGYDRYPNSYSKLSRRLGTYFKSPSPAQVTEFSADEWMARALADEIRSQESKGRKLDSIVRRLFLRSQLEQLCTDHKYDDAPISKSDPLYELRKNYVDEKVRLKILIENPELNDALRCAE